MTSYIGHLIEATNQLVAEQMLSDDESITGSRRASCTIHMQWSCYTGYLFLVTKSPKPNSNWSVESLPAKTFVTFTVYHTYVHIFTFWLSCSLLLLSNAGTTVKLHKKIGQNPPSLVEMIRKTQPSCSGIYVTETTSQSTNNVYFPTTSYD